MDDDDVDDPQGVASGADRRRRIRARMERLYPLCRSITGDGVRATLDVIEQDLPAGVELVRHEVPSGTQVHDWVVNEEWNVRGAHIADATGRRLVDLADHTLHLVSYSVPVRATMTLEELRPHLHTLPEHPDWIPYRTTYYARTWGFCLPHRRVAELEEAARLGPFEVVVDSTLTPGSLTYGEIFLPGSEEGEILLSAHLCHPSLANDNLSGLSVAAELVRTLAERPRRLGVRLVLAPGTIGSITWLSRNPAGLERIRHGLVLTGLGGPGPLVYKRTRRGARPVDRAAELVVRDRGGEVRDYSPYGYDERQYNALGFDLPVGRISRTPHGEYPEYHTSADDLGFVTDDELVASYDAVLEVLEALQHDRTYRNLSPYGEPQLGRRGLYPTTGGKSATAAVMAMLWLLASADGATSLVEVAEVSGVPVRDLHRAAEDLLGAGLLALEPDDD
ncbi:hypothetical protein I601_0090 [Nocardioides dokdonensis FR1436]|uniref:Polysaccharide biosynthesis protein with aminopeptidase-like domain protein n=1 Tax=Nocardioides dokdonensis FR1436 TaxID=1300347 RepID=A0A1A9GE85_9ACTN|nr:hypothetical protein I601_0090 [Nocardioides dokdonensis FR1436]